jgi:uncharacterized protein with PIN domain
MTDDRFVADAMLGKLVTYMRMAGYDVIYAPDKDAVKDDDVAELVEETRRTLITRDVELAERTGGVLVDSKQIEKQLRELADIGFSFELGEPSRCSVCNGTLSEIDETDAGESDKVPEDVERAWRCDDCGKRYWKGSHWDDVRETFENL